MRKTTLEAVGPAAEPAGGWDKLSLVLLVGNDLSDLGLDILRVGWLTTESLESVSGSFYVASLHEVSWGVWEEEESTAKDDSPSKLDGNWDSIRTAVLSVLGCVHNTGGKQDTKSNAELVSGDQGTSDLSWANFAHVEDNNGRFETDANASNETTSNDYAQVAATLNSSDHLDDNTEHVDAAAHDNGPLSADDFSHVTTNECTEESTSGENRDDER